MPGIPGVPGDPTRKDFCDHPYSRTLRLTESDKAQFFSDILRSQRAVNLHGSTRDSARWNNSEVELPPENRNSSVISTCREGIAMHKLTKGAPTHIGPATLASDIQGFNAKIKRWRFCAI